MYLNVNTADGIGRKAATVANDDYLRVENRSVGAVGDGQDLEEFRIVGDFDEEHDEHFFVHATNSVLSTATVRIIDGEAKITIVNEDFK